MCTVHMEPPVFLIDVPNKKNPFHIIESSPVFIAIKKEAVII